MWTVKKENSDPEDKIRMLEAALKGYPEVYAKFRNYPPSGRKPLSFYFANAKKEETRIKRLARIIDAIKNHKKTVM